VVQKKSSQILDLEQFGGEVPPCSAWNESPRYAVFSLPFVETVFMRESKLGPLRCSPFPLPDRA
jgi:hypothetical protein